MTLIVGIRCTDGVVIGTDSAVTFSSSPQQSTIEQSYDDKVNLVGQDVIVAGTGSLGLSQRFIESVKKIRGSQEFRNIQSTVDIGCMITQLARANFQATGVPQGRFGALVAIPKGPSGELIEFASADLQPEIKTIQSWYVSMGSGQPVADPLLGFIRTIFWRDGAPNRQEGIFAAVMVLELAFSMTPFGVSGPIQMATLHRSGQGQFVAQRLTESELDEHRTVADNAMEYFRQFSAKSQSPTPMPTPKP